jgi:hypothetical protein
LGQDGLLNTLSSGERDVGVLFVTNDEDVGLSSGEGLTSSISNVEDIEATRVSFSVDDNTDSTQVTTSGAHDEGTDFVLENFSGLASSKIEFNSVVGLGRGVGVSQSSTVMEGSIGNASNSSVSLLDSAELELGFISRDGVSNKSTLGIVKKSEVFVGLFDGDDIHETSGISSFSSNLTVNLDESLFHDVFNFLLGEGVFKSISDQEDEGQAFSSFMGTRDGLRSKDTAQFVQHPVVGGG